MIYFITNRTDHDSYIYKSSKITVTKDYTALAKFLEENKAIGYDSETTGGRLYKSELLLVQVGNKDNQFVLDCTAEQYLNHISFLNKAITDKHILFGHNLKFDRNMAYPYGLVLSNLFDTMLAEQRLTTGSGLSVSLVATCERRLRKYMDTDKDTRKDFIYMSAKSAKFLVKHVMYAGGDVVDVIDIAKVQREELIKTKQYNFLRNVEHYLIEVLSDMELEGVPHDEVKWKGIIDNKRLERFKTEKALDNELVTLAKGNPKLTGGIYNNNRKKGVTIQNSLFADIPPVEIENKNKHNINYNSGAAIMEALRRANYPIPQFKQRFGEPESDSLREEAIQSYLIEKPNSPLKPFFAHLLKYKELQKFISSYGPKFLYEFVPLENGKSVLGYRNSYTGRVHTMYKQCFTDTGRLSSGNKDEGYFNSQQLPAEKEIRETFCLTPVEIAEKWFISTYDLSGAEAIIMAALSGEYKLYELAVIKDDVHSPIATKCYRAIYEYRKAKWLQAKMDTYPEALRVAGLKEQLWTSMTEDEKKAVFTVYDSKKKPYLLTEDFLIDKKNNKDLRTDFKPYTFGTFYGMHAKKGGETINVPMDEAQIAINVIKDEFPLIIKRLDEAVVEAYTTGEVIFNTRSNNKRVFQNVKEILSTFDVTKYPKRAILNYVKSKLSFQEQADIEGAARNCLIQGTQADMIKEAMCELHRFIKVNNLPHKLLMTIHDELVVKHKDETFGKVIGDTMLTVANKYLSLYSDTIKMSVAGHTGFAWTK
jgi:DNA polymerase I-like protein with 3'-5' exonuclease and polymerase domains